MASNRIWLFCHIDNYLCFFSLIMKQVVCEAAQQRCHESNLDTRLCSTLLCTAGHMDYVAVDLSSSGFGKRVSKKSLLTACPLLSLKSGLKTMSRCIYTTQLALRNILTFLHGHTMVLKASMISIEPIEGIVSEVSIATIKAAN